MKAYEFVDWEEVKRMILGIYPYCGIMLSKIEEKDVVFLDSTYHITFGNMPVVLQFRKYFRVYQGYVKNRSDMPNRYRMSIKASVKKGGKE